MSGTVRISNTGNSGLRLGAVTSEPVTPYKLNISPG